MLRYYSNIFVSDMINISPLQKFCMYENSTDQWPVTPPDCGNGYENISDVVIEAEDVDTDANLTIRIGKTKIFLKKV